MVKDKQKKNIFLQLLKDLNNPLWLKEGEKRFEPVGRPIRRYENDLFIASATVTLLAKVIVSLTLWNFLYFVALIPTSISISISTIYLLFPPRYSNLRLTFIILGLICLSFIWSGLGF